MLLAGHRTWDSQVAGSSPGWTQLHSGLAQAIYTCVPLTPSSVSMVWLVSGLQVKLLLSWEILEHSSIGFIP